MKKKKWIPKVNEQYFFINKYMEISGDYYSNSVWVLESRNYFKTRTEAKKKLSQIKKILKSE